MLFDMGTKSHTVSHILSFARLFLVTQSSEALFIAFIDITGHVYPWQPRPLNGN